jgi:hypothetical protein
VNRSQRLPSHRLRCRQPGSSWSLLSWMLRSWRLQRTEGTKPRLGAVKQLVSVLCYHHLNSFVPSLMPISSMFQHWKADQARSEKLGVNRLPCRPSMTTWLPKVRQSVFVPHLRVSLTLFSNSHSHPPRTSSNTSIRLGAFGDRSNVNWPRQQRERFASWSCQWWWDRVGRIELPGCEWHSLGCRDG